MLRFPTVGNGKEWGLTPEKLAEYEEAYPDMDVILVAKRARQWLVDNPRKRKTPRGMPAFLGAWIERQQNNGHFPARGSSAERSTSPATQAGLCYRCDGKGTIPLHTGAWGTTEPCKRCQGTGRL